ncbi:MAG: MOSC domain-containing protein [Nitrospinota bacterium]
MQGVVERIFIAPAGGVNMQEVDQVEALANRGLLGDRYLERTGYWTGVDECQVTLIEAEGLEEIRDATGLHVENGEHRRNLITRGLRLEELAGKRFQAGGAVLEYDRPRPPCSYIQSITERGMTKALYGRSGICARVVQSGVIRAKDPIVVLERELESSR